MDRSDTDALVNAMAGTLGIIGALLERADIATIHEFAGALGVYGSVTQETDPQEAMIIGRWVLALREIAAQGRETN